MSSSLSYATLQDAWGDALPPRRRRKNRDAAPPVGVADDREYRESRVPGELEYRTPGAADDYLAWSDYSKELGQRTDAPLTGLDGPERRFPAEAAVVPDYKVDPADTGATGSPGAVLIEEARGRAEQAREMGLPFVPLFLIQVCPRHPSPCPIHSLSIW